MTKRWITVKVVDTATPMRVEFLALQQDTRDTMSDSLKPQWDKTGEYKVEFVEGLGVPSLVLFVDKATGNDIYTQVKAVADDNPKFMALYNRLKAERSV